VGNVGPYRVAAFQSLGSTNDEAMARLRGGDAGGLFVVAESQTGGRGRQGRSWTSPPGNLYASLALVDPAPLAVAPQLGFVAGVSLAMALRGLLGCGDRLTIKWPNDMLLDGAKLAGILLESTILLDNRFACVAGFGVNCRSHPEDLPYPATDLAAAGLREVAPMDVLSVLAESLASTLALWDRGANFAAVRDAWLGLAAELERPIEVATPGGRVSGISRGIDRDGHLLVDGPAGRVTIAAGDVFLPGLRAGAMHQIKQT
jgi:BirA family biotin operon repressor/biotin-[acetyl-CoA-carboxylase] ligase